MSERASYRGQEREERFSVFAGRFRTDPYDYSNIVVHARGLLGYPQRVASSTREAPDEAEYLAVYPDSQESMQKMHLLGQVFAARPISDTLYSLTTGQWCELLDTLTDTERARERYALSPEFPPHVVDHIAVRGLRTALERAQHKLLAQGEQRDADGDAVLRRLRKRQDGSGDPFTPEDLGGLAMPAMRDILRARPDLQPERNRIR